MARIARAADGTSDEDSSGSEQSQSDDSSSRKPTRKAKNTTLSVSESSDSDGFSDTEMNAVAVDELRVDPYEKSMSENIMDVFESETTSKMGVELRLRRSSIARRGNNKMNFQTPIRTGYTVESSYNESVDTTKYNGDNTADIDDDNLYAIDETRDTSPQEEKDQESTSPTNVGGLTTKGVSLSTLQKIRNIANELRKGMTTAEVVEDIIKPITKLFKCSFVHFLSNTNGKSPPDIGFSPGRFSKSSYGPGNIYISHAWDYKFEDLVNSLEGAEDSQNKSKDSGMLSMLLDRRQQNYYWIDVFCMNQWKPICTATKCPSMNWFRNSLPNLIKHIGTFCLIMVPWNEPIVLHRLWCLYEMAACYMVSVNINVRLSKNRHRMFIAMMREHYEECYRVIGTFEVNALESTAKSDPAIECMLDYLDEVANVAKAKEVVPPASINGLLKGLLFHWLDRQAIVFYESEEMRFRAEATRHQEKQVSRFNQKIQRSLCCNAFKCAEYYDETAHIKKLYLCSIEVSQALARLYVQTHNFPAAERKYAFCVEEAKQRLGPSHVSTLTLMGNLAVVQKKMGNFEEAEKLMRVTMAKKELTLGKTHSSYLSTMINLSLLLKARGKLDEARQFATKVVSIQEDLYGENDDATLQSVEFLASVLLELKFFDGTLILLKRILTAKTLKLGKKHREVHAALETVGDVYICQQKWTEASEMYSKACFARESSYGGCDPATLNCYSRYGKVQEYLNDWDKAEELYNKLLNETKKVMGSNHFGVFQTRDKLLGVYMKSKKKTIEDIIVSYHELLDDTIQCLGPMDPLVHTITQHLAEALVAANRYKDAIVYYRKAYLNRKKVFGEDDVYTLLAMQGLALALAFVKEFREAYDLFKDLISRFDRHPKFGPASSKVIDCVISFIEVCKISGDVESAEALMRRLLEHYQSKEGYDPVKAMGVIADLKKAYTQRI